MRMKHAGGHSSIFYRNDPMKVVGWKGDLFPFKLNVRNILSIMSDRIHVPPSSWVTFEAPGFVVLSIVPQIAVAASLGVTQLIVRCRPIVTLVLAGPKPPAIEALGLAISTLVARDGGAMDCARRHHDMARTLSCVAPADLFLVIEIGRAHV